VADRQEHAGDREVLLRAGLRVAQADAGDPVAAEHVDDSRFQCTVIFGFSKHALLHDLAGAEAVAAVDQVHAAAHARQEGRLLHRRVAAADHHDVLVAVERAVAGRAGRHAAAAEAQALLVRQAEPLRRRAGGDDQRVAGVDRRLAGS
jgi:hypothetical protein